RADVRHALHDRRRVHAGVLRLTRKEDSLRSTTALANGRSWRAVAHGRQPHARLCRNPSRIRIGRSDYCYHAFVVSCARFAATRGSPHCVARESRAWTGGRWLGSFALACSYADRLVRTFTAMGLAESDFRLFMLCAGFVLGE